MADMFTPEIRSRTMQAVKNRNTQPEMIVRRLLHALGYRFCLHRKDLPGSLDIVLSCHKKVIFAHGCFWHGHPECRRSTWPTSTVDFWNVKINRNIARDATALQNLTEKGWQVLTIWECQLRDRAELQQYLKRFLGTAQTGTDDVSSSEIYGAGKVA